MARIRTIKPEFWTHPVMGRQSDAAKCMALALLNLSDDEGYFYAEAAAVRSFARPFDDDSTISRRCLDELSKIGFIEIGQHPIRGRVGRVVNFLKHQRIDKPKASEIKDFFVREDSAKSPRPFNEESPMVSRTLDDSSRLEGKGKEQGKEQEWKGSDDFSSTFDGHEWCLETCKAHPKWEAPDAVEVPPAISQAYMQAVEGLAKCFGGNLTKAAEDLLARTRQFAKNVEGDKIMVGVLNFFRNGVYLEHQPEIKKPVERIAIDDDEALRLIRKAKAYSPPVPKVAEQGVQ